MITNCTICSKLYEAGSEEQANELGRVCHTCFKIEEHLRLAYVDGWLEGAQRHDTWGDVYSDERIPMLQAWNKVRKDKVLQVRKSLGL